VPVTPVFIAPIAYPIIQYAPFGIIGQFKISTRWWLICQEAASAISNTNLVIYFSDDDGLTWTRGGVGPTTNQDAAAVHYPGTGTNAIVAYQTTASDTSTNIVTVDLTGTGTFGSPVAFPFAADFNSAALAFQPLLLGSGDVAMVWQEQIGAGNWKSSVATPPPPSGCIITVLPFGPPPPPFCILPPATGQEQLALVNEPLENQGT